MSAPAWERILDAPASKLNENCHFSFLSVLSVLSVMMNWTLARPDCIPTPARGNEKTITRQYRCQVHFLATYQFAELFKISIGIR
jgi:hypothetical protein